MKKTNNLTFKVGFIIVIALIFSIGLHNYRKPIPIHKTFNETIIVKASNKKILKKTKIKIDANLYRGLYRGSILNFNPHFINKLEGTMVIDNKEYKFGGVTEGTNYKSALVSVFKDNQGDLSVFMFKMYDINSIVLLGMKEWDGQIIVAPAQTIEDYRYILDRPEL